jgi:hypothetical protein
MVIVIIMANEFVGLTVGLEDTKDNGAIFAEQK